MLLKGTVKSQPGLLNSVNLLYLPLLAKFKISPQFILFLGGRERCCCSLQLRGGWWSCLIKIIFFWIFWMIPSCENS